MSQSGILVVENDQNNKEAITFAVALARALQTSGIPSHRLEENMALLNRHLGIHGQFFSSPGVMMASFDREEGMRTFILRASSDNLNLEKQEELAALTSRIIAGELTPSQGSAELARITQGSDRYGPLLTVFCFMISSGGAARLFGGGWREVLVSSLIGLGLGLLIQGAGRFQSIGNVLAPVAAICAMLLANGATLVLGGFSVHTATVTGLIVLIPGMSLTLAMTELATGHPVSGTSRLSNAMVLFLMLGFGIALGDKLGKLLPFQFLIEPPHPLPYWTQWVALTAVPIGFVVLFKAKPKDLGLVFLAAVYSYYSTGWGNAILGPELGGFLAALGLGLGSNLFARITKRPGNIILIPGIMLLVPGSIGYRSLSSLLARETLVGVETAFTMTLVAISLVAGLLFANVIFAKRRPI